MSVPETTETGGGAATDTRNPIRVLVNGARGRMGSVACTAVENAEDLELVATCDAGDDLAHIVGRAVVGGHDAEQFLGVVGRIFGGLQP